MVEPGTKARIVEATRAIVLDHGADAVSMRKVAAAVGITPMAIYRHYVNRDELLRAVADDLGEQLREEWGKRSDVTGFEAQLRAQLEAFLDFALGQPGLYRFLMIDGWARARRFPDDFRGSGGPAFSRIVDLVRTGMEDGRLRSDDPLEVALSVTAQTQGLVQLYLSGRMSLSEQEFRALCDRAMWRVIHGVCAPDNGGTGGGRRDGTDG